MLHSLLRKLATALGMRFGPPSPGRVSGWAQDGLPVQGTLTDRTAISPAPTRHGQNQHGPGQHGISGRPADRRMRRGRAGSLRVAIVEDNAFQRGALERMLSKAGFQCSVYEDPRAAIDGIAVDPVDVVVSDVFLPGCDGFELVERLRLILPDLACVLVTSHERDEIPASRHNADIVLHKPVSAAMLTDALRHAAG